ncbi:MAG: pyridoxal-phosphate-dependent aminotransferase family protein [Anaerolineae bacterium]
MKKLKLMIPGPVDVEEEVLMAMASPSMPHYGPDWMEIYTETIESLKKVFQTENDLFLMVAPGSGALDAALGSLLGTGEKVLIPVNGFFGRRLASIAQSYGLEVVSQEFPAGQPIQPEAVRDRLDAEEDIQAIAIVHHETSTGVLNPLQKVAAIAGEMEVPIVVDAVSSLGGVPLPVDEWGIDICVTVGNKCLETPPGLSAISISQRAWEIIESKGSRNHGWYLNLQTWRKYAEDWATWHPYPTTLATNNILALRVSLRRILAEGLENRFSRHLQAARWVREGLRNLGFEMMVEDAFASPLTTAVKARPEVSPSELAGYLRSEHGIMISGGLEELAGKIFRVGHMGKAANRDYVLSFLFGVEDFLRYKGEKVAFGQSLEGMGH